MKFRRPARRFRALICTMLSLIVLMSTVNIVGVAKEADNAQPVAPTVSEFDHVGDGLVRVVWSNGVSFVGSPDAKVTMYEWRSTDGKRGKGIVEVTPTRISSDDEIAQAARDYANAGRSPSQDQQVLGVTNDIDTDVSGATQGTIYDSGCVSPNTNEYQGYGCFRRYVVQDADPHNYYSLDSSQVTGNTKGQVYMSRLRNAMLYGIYTQVVNWRPVGTESTGSCSQMTYQLSAYGVTVSETVNRCPERFEVSVGYTHLHTDWVGEVPAGVDRQSLGSTVVRTQNGVPDGFTYQVEFDWFYRTCC